MALTVVTPRIHRRRLIKGWQLHIHKVSERYPFTPIELLRGRMTHSAIRREPTYHHCAGSG